MSNEHYKKALKLLQEINNFTVESTKTSKDKNTIYFEYKPQEINLGDYTLIVSGSAQQFNSTGHSSHSSDKVFLLMSLYDSEKKELGFNAKQNSKFKSRLYSKIKEVA